MFFLNIYRIIQDLQGSELIGSMEDCKTALFNLVLNGIATPYLHNNESYYDKNGESAVS
jgi:hypothetical protein